MGWGRWVGLAHCELTICSPVLLFFSSPQLCYLLLALVLLCPGYRRRLVEVGGCSWRSGDGFVGTFLFFYPLFCSPCVSFWGAWGLSNPLAFLPFIIKDTCFLGTFYLPYCRCLTFETAGKGIGGLP
ncbi:hypothetical protein F4810DRAFT_675932 [Camillea tinctor]|nr:hypothetical protein F4810DRAFT_675932 [Camillea tinctor]